MPNPLYAVRQSGPDAFQMAKFSMPDFNVAAIYNLTRKGHSYTCDCPASARAVKTKPCKHQRMMPYMLGAVNSDRFYEPETGNWMIPLPPELTKEGYDGTPPTEAEIEEGIAKHPDLTRDQVIDGLAPNVLPTPEPPVVVPSPQAQAGVDATTQPPSRPTIARRI